MTRRRAWSILGHALFLATCLVLAAGIGMAGAIGCGYGGSGCTQTGLLVFAVALLAITGLGYGVRFAAGFILSRLYDNDRRPKI
jgi:hypothetical protein